MIGGPDRGVIAALIETSIEHLVAVSFYLLAPYIAAEAVRARVAGDLAETSIIGLVLTAGTAVFEPALGVAQRRIGVGSDQRRPPGRERRTCCAPTSPSVFAGLAANTLPGARWLDEVVARNLLRGLSPRDGGPGRGDPRRAHASPSRGPKAARYLAR